jgi:biotin carboxyl carrier protein
MSKNLYTAVITDKTVTISEISDSLCTIDGKDFPFSWSYQRDGFAILTIGKNSIEVYCQKKSETHYDIWFESNVVSVELEDIKHQLLSKLSKLQKADTGPVILRAPMPGLIRTIEVTAGDLVESGQGLIILEAMKMENELRSPVKGSIRRIDVHKGDAVEKGQILLTIEPVGPAKRAEGNT